MSHVRRHIKRRDANHDQILGIARSVPGVTVTDTHLVGHFVDAVLCHRGRVVLVEIKDGAKPPSARRLTPGEQEFHARAALSGVRVEIVECAADLYRVLGIEPAR